MASTTTKAAATPRPSLLSRIRRRFQWFRGDTAIGVLVLTPSLLVVAVFIYGFIFWTGYVSLVNWNTVVRDFSFVGLRNWVQLFGMERFHWNIRNLVLYTAGFMAQCIVIGFLLAVFLDQNIRGEQIFRTIYVLPFAVSLVVTGVAWRWLMQPRTGLNLLIRGLGFTEFNFAWNADPKWGILAISVAGSWRFMGYIMSLYLAGLRSISDEIREAALIDGAGTLRLYRSVIIPLLRPVTFTAVVLIGMQSIRVFDLITILAGAAHTTDTLGFHMYQSTFGLYRFSLGAAIGFFMVFLSLFLVVPYMRSMKLELER